MKSIATAIALLALTAVTATAHDNDFADSVPEEKAVEKSKLSKKQIARTY